MAYEGVGFREGTTFLVTGGAGFIGSHLCDALLRLGHEVRCLDDLSTGSRANVDLFTGRPGYTFVRGDIRDFDTCMAATDGIDYVLHEAAWGSVPRSIEQPLLYEDINVRGTLNMLEASRRSGVRRFIYASSSSVYGDSPALPKREGEEGGALSPYAVTKRNIEEYGRLYAKLYDLDTCGLRYFNVFGPRQDPAGAYAAAIPKFISQLLRGEDSIIYGDGTQSRDFTYVENVVEANLKACVTQDDVSGEVFNVAFGAEERLIDVYETLMKALAVVGKPRFAPARAGDIKHSVADISKARRLLGYDPTYSLSDGIQHSIAWYRNALL